MDAPPPLTIVLVWLPALLWGGLIWLLGGDAWSARETSGLLLPFLEWLLPDADFVTRVRVMSVIRKLAHPGVYGVLAALAFPAASWTLRAVGAPLRLALCLAPVAALAVADEWRQSASAVRTGAPFDVLLDMAGGLAVVALALTVERCIGGRLFAPVSRPIGVRPASATRRAIGAAPTRPADPPGPPV